MTPITTKRRLTGILTGFVAFNLLQATFWEFIPPIDRTKALAYLALAVAFTACLIAMRRP